MPEPASEPAYGEQNEALEPGVDRVLVIDDDRELCELVREYLVQECFYVDLINEGRHGLEQALSGKYDVVILDVMLPGMNGLQVLQAIRRASRVGVLMLTARGEDVDRILGLEHGADDYLPKPFNPRELVARIRAVLRRLRPAGASDGLWSPERLELGDLYLDQGSRTCRVGGTPVELTTTEFDLVAMFLVGGTLALSVASSRIDSADSRFRSVADRVVRLEAEHAARVFEQGGPAELQKYLAEMSDTSPARPGLFNSEGRNVLGQES